MPDAGIETQLFPRDLTAQVEELNRDFIRAQKEKRGRNLLEPSRMSSVAGFQPWLYGNNVNNVVGPIYFENEMPALKKDEAEEPTCDTEATNPEPPKE